MYTYTIGPPSRLRYSNGYGSWPLVANFPTELTRPRRPIRCSCRPLVPNSRTRGKNRKCLSVYCLFLMHGHSFERICARNLARGILITCRWSRTGLVSVAGTRGLALRSPGNSELAGSRSNGSSAVDAWAPSGNLQLAASNRNRSSTVGARVDSYSMRPIYLGLDLTWKATRKALRSLKLVACKNPKL